jgi:Zn-dependent protease with chaperone function
MRITVPYKATYVQSLINRFAHTAGVTPPRFRWNHRVRLANYFAVSNTLHVNPYFAGHLPEDEFWAVLAHEVGHARQRWAILTGATVRTLFNPMTLLVAWGIHPHFSLMFLAFSALVLGLFALGPKMNLAKELDADRYCVRVLADEEALNALLFRLACSGKPMSRSTRARIAQLDAIRERRSRV